MSYFKLINGIKELLEVDERVKTITEGDISDLDAYKQNLPTLAHIVVDGGSALENLNTYNVVVSVLDIIVENNNITVDKFKGNDNSQEIYNQTDNIIRRFFMVFNRNAEGQDIFIEESPTFSKVEEYDTENRLAGWELSFTVGVPNDKIDVCDPI
tara:strand:- start:133 stop:597 length:465 start_codon:yes stop_codon:yes gene_type:complete